MGWEGGGLERQAAWKVCAEAGGSKSRGGRVMISYRTALPAPLDWYACWRGQVADDPTLLFLKLLSL